MERREICRLLNSSSVSKFVTKKCIEKNDLSDGQYSDNKKIKLKTPTVRSDLCDYREKYIVVKGSMDSLRCK